MKQPIAFVLFCFVHAGAVCHDPRPAPIAEQHRPTSIPDRIILTWATDPATSQAVTWRTDTTVEKGFAEIAVALSNADFVGTAKRIEATTQKLTVDLGSSHYHTAFFTDLAPKSPYLYRVGDGVNWSEWFLFRTASKQAEPFQFVYFGDAQNDLKEHWSRVIREANQDAPRAAFFLHAGDLVNNAHQDAQWGEWHRAGGWLNGMTPSIPSPGNHEYNRHVSVAGISIELSKQWRPQFALPTHGPPGLEEVVYHLDYQGVRFISLDSNRDWEKQIPWLEERLKVNPNRWTILTFHHPIYSAARGRDNPKLRTLWQPLFDKYKVDLVLTGHDHSYARSGLMVHQENVPIGAWKVGKAGTIYVTSVSGPKWYRLEREDFMVRAAESTQLYQIIGIDGDQLTYEARTALGEPYDGFQLKKKENQPNELIERVPKTPERRASPNAKKTAAAASPPGAKAANAKATSLKTVKTAEAPSP